MGRILDHLIYKFMEKECKMVGDYHPSRSSSVVSSAFLLPCSTENGLALSTAASKKTTAAYAPVS